MYSQKSTRKKKSVPILGTDIKAVLARLCAAHQQRTDYLRQENYSSLSHIFWQKLCMPCKKYIVKWISKLTKLYLILSLSKIRFLLKALDK